MPQTLAVVRTRALATGVDVVVVDGDLVGGLQTHEAFAIVVQVPGADGALRSADELRAIAATAHDNNATVIAAADLLALTMITAPAGGAPTSRWAAPALRRAVVLRRPARRLSRCAKGWSVSCPDASSASRSTPTAPWRYGWRCRPASSTFAATGATSNICTAQVLLAVTASFYAVYHGPHGLRTIAEQVHHKFRRLASALAPVARSRRSRSSTPSPPCPAGPRAWSRPPAQAGVHLRLVDADHVGVSVGEDTTEADLAAVCTAFGVAAPSEATLGDLAGHDRAIDYLTHPVFNSRHSETGCCATCGHCPTAISPSTAA